MVESSVNMVRLLWGALQGIFVTLGGPPAPPVSTRRTFDVLSAIIFVLQGRPCKVAEAAYCPVWQQRAPTGCLGITPVP